MDTQTPFRHPPQHLAQPRVRPQPTTPGEVRCAEALLGVLTSAGVRHYYGVPGGAISATYDALHARPDLRVVHVRHESSAAHMAIGHAVVRPDEMVCVLTTSGPGVTNLLTGLSSAYAERVPLIVLAGEVPRAKFGRGALQEGGPGAMDIVAMARSVTRLAQLVEIPRHAPRQLAAAIAVARRERGPVLLSLPLDVALARIPDIACPVPEVQPLRPNERFLDTVAAALSRARRPLILVGPEARPSAPAIRALASRLRIPVMTSPAAKGIVPEDRPGCLGVFGFGGHPSTRRWLEQERPDTLLVLGCSLSEVSTNSWSELLQPAETMIQLDSDSRRIGVNYRVDLAFAGDWHGAIEAIDHRLNETAPKAIDPPGVTRLEAERETEDTAVLHPARLLVALQSLLPGDALFTADIGENLLFAVHHLRIREPDQFVTAIESGSMGSGLGAAVGAKAAAPNRTVVSICGDYAFQMYGMELATCVQEGWDVIFVVMNDARMRMVEAGLTRIYGRTLDMSGPTIDFAALARAHGAAGVVIETAQDLVEAISTRPPDRPLLLDCRIDPAASFSANARVQELGTFNED